MLEKLAKIADRYEEITALLSQPAVIADSKRLQQLSKEQAKMTPLVAVFRQLSDKQKELADNQQLSEDESEESEIRELAREETYRLKREIAELSSQARQLLLPKDPDDEKNTILEIRAGTGGEEAALFVADLYRMYLRFAENSGWKVELVSANPTGIGGFKEIVVAIEGKNVYSRLKFEAGTHRVQRIPQTEAQGRIHTSAVTVAVLPEADDIDVTINPTDLRIDTYRSQGAGGQHVNTSDSAIRITHLPTGVVVTCQDERSQLKNKNKALKHLKAKLYEMQLAAVVSEEAQRRKGMVGSGDRSERIRTYNFPQGRITDHRIGLTLYRLEDILNSGDINEIIDSLIANHQAELMEKEEIK